ncbi:carbamoyl-phosphate synthase large subunit [Ponticaulis sp.]|uniref:carbamoyl-phosphate synthase large subunit n=1 Tax=Ponticaulis sp. TaxID=2020902 RepID=UPI000B62D449|nr:carbamoyl-phosphate synthase large subunit [Ponticaulis sp.]MAI90867.1 carbamoyl phosphate synthase large subunit [Ponticaulis sp.]OUX98841.1 MAG: carbamoyl phosphate synthase large subunit [Hyphomonadaceae bacterium TMED5]|tara:strand:+ start:30786 stop:34082 length:3297 start_codon:yes stop_codon:yes gene_type:complete
MPKRTDIESILVIGAGPIVIGQACEFDYSGVQAIKALKSEGYRVILVNSNPATIMTDPDLADATYIEPITPDFVAKIIEAEKPDALLPTMGGQTALNCALELERMGVLEKFGVEMIGAKADAINKAEDRKLFREAMDKIGLENPRAVIIGAPEIKDENGNRTGYDRITGLKMAMDAIDEVGLPAIIRPAFTLGGTGGGIANNREEYEQFVRSGLAMSPVAQVLIDESLLGWKEYEMEVVRDNADNCIIICSIENIDPMGVHTGDSVTVAPALTLSDREYQVMRNASIAVLREIGVETGGSNVQFAVNPDNGRVVVIEMNPRVSRSSALASKATGFPIAKIAAKLAVGYTLDELDNDITGVTPASFEPTIDYVVTKIPRFDFEKYKGADVGLTTSMKSVGEAMAIGRTFQESLQKALRSMETGLDGLNEIDIDGLGQDDDRNVLKAAVSKPTKDRIRTIAQALRSGLTVEEVHDASHYDLWFLRQIAELVEMETTLMANGLPDNADDWTLLKSMGFSDSRLAHLANSSESEVRRKRQDAGVFPVFKRIDTCAAEFAAKTPYLYSTYEQPLFGQTEADCEADVSERKKVIILGGGPNRIGQGIEFDYCCCHAAFAMEDLGIESIMVNCNPETVSTDYDTSDRLYFEPLTAETVLEIIRKEMSKGELLGVIVQFGGQTPLKLARLLSEEGVPILGTSPDSIDLAEDRERFTRILDEIGLKQAPSAIARSEEEVLAAAEKIGYPLMLRPSYVLGGRAMEVVRDDADLKAYVRDAVNVSGDQPLLCDRYLADAIEVDVDALCDGVDVHIAGVMEHIEEAGVHSGDSACSLPPYSLPVSTITQLERQAAELAMALDVRGLINIQFAVKGEDIFVLEANPRASRTVPFVAKAVNAPIAAIAAKVMAGEPLSSFNLAGNSAPRRIAVKEAVFPFARFQGVDPVLGPEMRSTGEVMGWDDDFGAAFLKTQIAAGVDLPTSGRIFVSVKDADKPNVISACQRLIDLGFELVATSGTATYLANSGLAVKRVNKVAEGSRHIVDMITDGEIALVFNTTEGAQSMKDSKSIRETVLKQRVPYFTTLAASKAAVKAIEVLLSRPLEVRALQS